MTELVISVTVHLMIETPCFRILNDAQHGALVAPGSKNSRPRSLRLKTKFTRHIRHLHTVQISRKK
jgi:hypothetical protein